MFAYARSLFRVTAVRLSIVYTLIFGVVAVGIVAYMTGATVNLLRQQYEESIDGEIKGLSRIYQQRGLRGLIVTLDRRSRAPGANLYVVTNPSGEIVAGNVQRIDAKVMRRIGWTGRPFQYDRYSEDPDKEHRAIARVIQLPNGLRILVGRDIGEFEGFRKVVGSGFTLALGTMVALGVLTWFFVGRRALKRIDGVSKSSMRIMGGDRSERLPVTGSGDEFDRLSENLNNMLDRIHRLDDGLKQMSDNIAHDLKTPITRLRNKADEALSNKGNPEEREQALSEIIADCDQIVRTFDALLMISRVESGSTVAKMNRLNVWDLLSDVHELYEAVAESEGISLELANGKELDVEVNGNRELLSQAVSNLVDNAMKYGIPSQGEAKVRLALEVDKTHCVISVMDNGEGIPVEERERVKDRFVRLDKSRNKSGNGLGLSLVEAIAELHRGSVQLADGEPGLVVSITLPLPGEADA